MTVLQTIGNSLKKPMVTRLPFPQPHVHVGSWLEVLLVDTFALAFAVVFVEEDVAAVRWLSKHEERSLADTDSSIGRSRTSDNSSSCGRSATETSNARRHIARSRQGRMRRDTRLKIDDMTDCVMEAVS